MVGFVNFAMHLPPEQRRNEHLPIPFPNIEKRTGIAARHIIRDEDAEALMAMHVIGALRMSSRLRHTDYGGLVFSSSSAPDPQATAAQLAALYGFPDDAHISGINSACTGFLAATQQAVEAVESSGKPVFVIASEQLTRHVDYGDENTAILFGDCAAGALIAADGRHRIHDVFCREVDDPQNVVGLREVPNALDIDGRESRRMCLHMPGGKALYRIAPQRFIDLMNEGLANYNVRHPHELPLTPDHIYRIVPHQPNGKMVDRFADLLKTQHWAVPPPPIERNVFHYGNIGSAAIPAAIFEGQCRFGQKYLLACPAVGGGRNIAWGKMTEGNLLMEWEADAE